MRSANYTLINPAQKLKVIKEEDLKDHVATIGDIHGCSKELKELIAKLPPSCSIIRRRHRKQGAQLFRCLELLKDHTQ